MPGLNFELNKNISVFKNIFVIANNERFVKWQILEITEVNTFDANCSVVSKDALFICS